MGRVIGSIRNFIKRRNTRISALAILHDVEYDKTSAVKAMAKLERAKIGKCTYIGTMAAAYDCEIGSFCSIARECYIGGASHPIDWVSTSPCFHVKSNPTGVCYADNDFRWNKKTTIGNDVWLGTRTMILSGVSIADGAVVGAGSVVTKDIGPYEIWAGNPARFIRKRFDDETIARLMDLRWWEMTDEELIKYGRDVSNVEQFIRKNRKESRYL